MYSIDFYDEKMGFAIGGDYTKPNDTLANKIRTTDGGKTWQVVADGKGPGYRSCVQYIPNSNGKELVAIGEMLGHLLDAQTGENGFGYDPIFIPKNKNKTFGEMSSLHKYKMDHRFDAFKKIKKFL